jgi:hypothetical protein
MMSFHKSPTACCLSLAILLGTAPLLPASQPAAPQTAPGFQAGDTLLVATENTALRMGDKVLATLSCGRPVTVTEVREGWVGVCVLTDGRRSHGWVQSSHVLPAGQMQMASSSGAQLACVASPASTCVEDADSSDPFLVGRYQRHELDPNMHVWEPWRQ